MRAVLAFLVLLMVPRAGLAATHVTFVTDGPAGAEQGGFYEALAEGLYTRRGLDVTIRAAGSGESVPQLLTSGAADFGLAANSFTVLRLVRDKVPLRAVMAVFQKAPVILISHPRHDLGTLAEMKGMPIYVSAEGARTYWPWLRAQFGFTDAQIRPFTGDLAPFFANPNAIVEGRLTRDPFIIQTGGHFTPKIFLLADYGYPAYADLVLASQKRIDADPRTIQAFYDATRDGWYDYLNRDPGPADALIKRANPAMTDARLAQALTRMKRHRLVTGRDAPAFGTGAMTDKRWRAFYQAVTDEGLFPRGMDYTKGYDLRFMRRSLQNYR